MKSANCISATGRRPISARTGRAADDRRLGERRVDDAPRPELLLEAERHLERSSVHADVLAEDEDARVASHLEPQPVGDRLDVGQLGHDAASDDGFAVVPWEMQARLGRRERPYRNMDATEDDASRCRSRDTTARTVVGGSVIGSLVMRRVEVLRRMRTRCPRATRDRAAATRRRGRARRSGAASRRRDVALLVVGHVRVVVQPRSGSARSGRGRPTARTSPWGRRRRRRARRAPSMRRVQAFDERRPAALARLVDALRASR